MLLFRANRRRRLGAFDRNLVFALIAIGICVTAIGFWQLLNQPEPIAENEPQTPEVSPVAPKAPAAKLPKDWVTMGGVARPATDVRTADKVLEDREVPMKPEGAPPNVSSDANEQVKMVHEALKTGKHPERISSFVVNRSFDEKAFKANPEQYAAEYSKAVEPGRVFAPAQPAEGTKALRSLSDRIQRVRQGESVRLAVAATPNAPVTFTSFGMGQFENLLSSTTVVADAEGKAQATFTATSGTKNEVKVLAASPVLSEQVAYTVAVRLPAPKESL